MNFSIRNSKEQSRVGDDPIAFVFFLVRDLYILGLPSHDDNFDVSGRLREWVVVKNNPPGDCPSPSDPVSHGFDRLV